MVHLKSIAATHAPPRQRIQSEPADAARAIFFVVLALMGLGFLMQVSHASTTLPPESFPGEVGRLARFRLLGLIILLLAMRGGPRGIERHLTWLSALVIAMLIAVYLPFLNMQVNGSRRWLDLPGVPFSIQPSELARVVAVLWVARRCTQLDEWIGDLRRGFLPMLCAGLALFALILFEPDFGGAILFFVCFLSTMWVGGVRRSHVIASGAVGLGAVAFFSVFFSHVKERIAIWLGSASNDQVARALQAMASGDFFGVGLTHGGFRNQSLQYTQTDYALSLVGEELGLVGVLIVVGLLFAFIYHSLRLVNTVPDRFSALAAFGLLVSVAFQAMLHVQVVTGLAPPKGINLPLISEGGSSLVASCLAVGLALGAARRTTATHPPRRTTAAHPPG